MPVNRVLKFDGFIFESRKSLDKKALFISFTDKTRGVSYHDYIKSKIPADFCKWEDLVFEDDDIIFNGHSLSKYGFVFIGVVSRNPDYFVSVEEYLNLHKIPYFKYGCSPERNNKILQNRILNSKNLNPVPTVIGFCSEVNPKDLTDELGLPIVAKITDGSQGKGVTLQKTMTDLKSYLKKNSKEKIIFQKFIENDGDYRLFFIGGKLLYSIERKSSNKNKEFRNNYSLGGTVKRVDLPKKAIELAKKSAKAMGFDVAGVDLMKDPKDDKWYVLEINSAPQFGIKDGNKIITDYREVLDNFIEIIKDKIS